MLKSSVSIFLSIMLNTICEFSLTNSRRSRKAFRREFKLRPRLFHRADLPVKFKGSGMQRYSDILHMLRVHGVHPGADHHQIPLMPEESLRHFIYGSLVKLLVNREDVRACLLYTSPSPRDCS